MTGNETLSLDEVFEKELQNPEFQKELRLRRPYEDLIVQIVNRRIDLKLTQKQLATRAKTFQSRISKIESGEHDVRLSTIIRIAEALETELLLSFMPFEIKRANDFSYKVVSDYSNLFDKVTKSVGISYEEQTSTDYPTQDIQKISFEQSISAQFDIIDDMV